METHRLPADAAMQRDPVDTGWSRAIRRGPRTIDEVLKSASERMDAEDLADAQARDPVLWIRARRRRTLLGRLLYGRG